MKTTTLLIAWSVILSESLFAAANVDSSLSERTPNVILSTAGFVATDKGATAVKNFNVGWRFYKGTVKGAEAEKFDDSKWPTVSAPHGLEILPLESSGGVNSQCDAWYRKRFDFTATPDTLTWLHFEGIMGKSKIYINGKLAATQFGGFLPVNVNATPFLKNGENMIAVWCNNQNDPTFPPGKPQSQLDFCYYGGLYRDVWLISTPQVFHENVHIVTKGSTVYATVSIHNETAEEKSIPLQLSVSEFRTQKDITIPAGKTVEAKLELPLKNPKLWTPDTPHLYTARISADKDVRDYSFGFKEVAFNVASGLVLNGKPYPTKLFGVNRHQDFAYIGNALPNSLHIRDVIKLREAGVRVIRNAHYPQDPAFMDACDAFGLFVIENTPGWQFWNNAQSFVQGIYSDITRMVTRDRNRPSLLFWEPILNETHYPKDFAAKARDLVRKLDTANGACACDLTANGHECYDIIYQHPPETAANASADAKGIRPSFTREFGDCVDNWNSHNSPSRVLREWGETAQLIQANHYVHAPYPYTDLYRLSKQPAKHFGGTLWHAFDHGRGYHPDNFWGGIMDAARQPKLSYYGFKAALTNPKANPNELYFVKIAHEMTPFSPESVTVFSNCARVKLRALGKECGTMSTRKEKDSICEPVVFTNAFHFIDLKAIVRARKWENAVLVADGFDDSGKLVATQTVKPAYRRTALKIKADSCGVPWQADGSDIMPIVVQLADDQGTVKRLETERILLTVKGDATLINAPGTGINPQTTRWGEAVFLLRAGTKPSTITVTAEILRKGEQISGKSSVTLETIKPKTTLIYKEEPTQAVIGNFRVQDVKQIDPAILREVEKDQSYFE